MRYNRIGVVVPTVRPEAFLKFCIEWAPIFNKHRAKLYIVEDSPTKKVVPITDLEDYEHFSWKEIENDLKGDSWIVGRETDSIRSYGFLRAYRDLCEVVVTLDDDVSPLKEYDILDEYKTVFTNGVSISNYFNVASLVSSNYDPVRFLRGYPFEKREPVEVLAQYGGWEGAPDLGAVEALSSRVGMCGFSSSVLTVPIGTPTTCCSMTAAFSRECVPISYQLFMGRDSIFNRWGDIWSGLFIKKIADKMNQAMVLNGRAKVKHNRLSKSLDNLVKESSGYKINESLWDTIQNIKGENKIELYLDIARLISLFHPSMQKVAEGMKIWTNLLQQ